MMDGEEMKARLLRDRFDALIMDGMSAGFTARQVYTWLGEKCPAMQKSVLFTFSSIAEPEVRDFLQEREVPYLVKPFEVADLISQARKLLHKVHAAAAGD